MENVGYDTTFLLQTNGRVNVNWNNDLTNIDNATDIILFGMESKLYILDLNGNIYEYDPNNIDNEIYSATKLNNYTNIKKIIKYRSNRRDAGGCSYLVSIDNNNIYKVIDSYCV